MTELSCKNDQIDEVMKVDSEPIEKLSADITDKQKNISEDNMDTNKNGNQNEDKNNIVDETVEEVISTNIKRSNDQIDDERNSSNKSDSNSDEDSNKRQKLNEFQPKVSTSTNANQQESSFESTSNFRKLESKVRKRNYRSQSNSSNVMDDSIEEARQEECVQEESNSVKSEEFQENDEVLSESSDQSSEEFQEDGGSNESTTDDSDDVDEIPAVLQKVPPKSDWSIIKDVTDRQIGFNNSVPNRFYSSLHAVQRLELMYKLEEHQGCVNALGFNQQGNLLVSSSDDLSVTVWNWAIGRKQVSLQSGHKSNVFQSKWLSLDMECYVATCARDGQVRLIDFQTGTNYKVAQHRAACHKISTHINLPHIILSAGEDSKVYSIDVRERKPTKLLSVKENDHEVELYSIHSHPLKDFEFCVAGRPRYVKIYDRRKLSNPVQQLCPKHLLSNKFAHITCAVYNHNGTEIVASYNNDDIYLFDASSAYKIGDFAHRYQGHRNSATVKGVNFFGPKSEFVLSGSDCGNIFIWDKKTEAIVQWMPGDEQGIVNALEPHPHIPILATSGLDYDVKIWIPSREETPDIKEELRYCIKRNSMVLWTMLGHIYQAQTRNIASIRNITQDNDDDEDDDDDDDHDSYDNSDDAYDNGVESDETVDILSNSSDNYSISLDILSDNDNLADI